VGKSYSLAIFAMFLWGIHGPAGRWLALENISMHIVTVLRFWIGALVIGVYLIARKRVSFSFFSRYRDLFPIAALGIALNSIVYHLGFNYVSATAAMLLENLAPFFVMFLAWRFDGERFERAKIAFGVLGFVGLVCVVLGRGGVAASGSQSYLWGVLLELAAGATFGYYTWSSGRFLSKHLRDLVEQGLSRSDVVLNLLFHVFVLSGLLMLPLLFVKGVWPQTGSHWFWVFEMGVFQSGLAYIIWNNCIYDLSASTASFLFFLTAIFTVINETIFLGYVPNAWIVSGSVLILLGVFGAVRQSIKSARSQVSESA
jgi:DME family drug/metabolite transporter